MDETNRGAKPGPTPALAFFASAVLAAFSLAVFGAALSGETPEPGIRVLSFNIRYDEPADGPNAWPLRKDLVIRTVAESRADIAGLQEALIGQIRDLETGLHGYAWVGVGRDDGKEAGEFCPILYRRDRYRLVSSGTFWLSETPDLPGRKGWDAGSVRIVTWARLEDKAFGRSIAVFNTHFDNIGPKAKAESAHLILARIRELAGECPVILTADLNSDRSGLPYRILLGEKGTAFLRDARDLSATGTAGESPTYNGFGQEGVTPEVSDYIFVGPVLEVVSWGVLTGMRDGRYVSDHNPVLAELRLGR